LGAAKKAGGPAGRGKTGADAPVISLRLHFLFPGRCLTVFSLRLLLLSVLLLGLLLPEGQRNEQPDGPLRLPGVAGSSSPTALTGRAGKLRRTAMRSGPAG